MVGQWDDYFSIIKTQYKWADHVFSPPGRINENTSLIIVNNRHYFNNIVSTINGQDLDIAIIVYDDSQVIPVDERGKALGKVCYLRSSSPRYINGHIRSMLQLQKSFYGEIKNYPFIVTDQEILGQIDKIIEAMDHGMPINVVTGSSYHFYLLFRTISLNLKTHYNAALYISDIDQFDKLASHEFTTLLLNVSTEQELDEYLKKPIMEYSIVFISQKELASEKIHARFDLLSLTKSKPAFFLSAYYYSLQQNRADKKDRTRFVQMGDLKKLYDESEDFFEFYEKLKQHHDENSLRFKNMAPMIRNASYGLHHLDKLIDELVGAIYNDFFEQTNHVFGTCGNGIRD